MKQSYSLCQGQDAFVTTTARQGVPPGGRPAWPEAGQHRLPVIPTLTPTRSQYWEPAQQVPAAGRGQHPSQQAAGASRSGSGWRCTAGGRQAGCQCAADGLLHCCVGCLTHQADGFPAPAQQPRKAGRVDHTPPCADIQPGSAPKGRGRRHRQPQGWTTGQTTPPAPPICYCCTLPCDLGGKGPSGQQPSRWAHSLPGHCHGEARSCE